MPISRIISKSEGTNSVVSSYVFSATNTTGGDTIVVALSIQGGTSVHSITDTDGNTYTQLGEQSNSARLVYFIAENITTSASNVITASWTSSGRVACSVDVYSGVDSYYGVLTANSQFGSPLSIDATPISTDDLILLYVSGQNVSNPTYGTGQTQIHSNTTYVPDLLATEEIPTNTSLNTQTADAGFAQLAGGVVILQASTGGGGGGEPRRRFYILT